MGTQFGYADGYSGGLRPSMSRVDTRYLEFHGGSWRVVVPVPRRLQKQIGKTKLKRSLKTDSLKLANTLKWPVVAELKKQIRLAAQGTNADPLLEEALMAREALLREKSLDEQPEMTTLDGIQIRAEMIAELSRKTGWKWLAGPYRVIIGVFLLVLVGNALLWGTLLLLATLDGSAPWMR